MDTGERRLSARHRQIRRRWGGLSTQVVEGHYGEPIIRLFKQRAFIEQKLIQQSDLSWRKRRCAWSCQPLKIEQSGHAGPRMPSCGPENTSRLTRRNC